MTTTRLKQEALVRLRKMGAEVRNLITTYTGIDATPFETGGGAGWRISRGQTILKWVTSRSSDPDVPIPELQITLSKGEEDVDLTRIYYCAYRQLWHLYADDDQTQETDDQIGLKWIETMAREFETSSRRQTL